MRRVSVDELRELATQVGVEVDDEEAAAVRDRTNSLLDGLDDVYELDALDDGPDATARSWSRPTDDPHNALSTRCAVGPYADNSGLLAGVDVGVKDIIAVAGVPMDCGSAVMHGYVPATDATVVDRLRRAGATIAAKTNLDELAASPWGNSFSGTITNPHDETRIAGGSSGGSAVAVATDQVDVALGTDTGGSVRIPAAFCGVVGLKPTYGLVPLRGVLENTYTQDHVGPMTVSVADAARVLEVIAGPDERDPSSLGAAGREEYHRGGYVDAVERPMDAASLTVGRLTEGFGEGISATVEERTSAALDELADAGGSIVDVSVEGYAHAGAVKNVLSVTELACHWRDGAAPVRRGGTVEEGFQATFQGRAQSRSGELGPYYKAKLLAGARILDAHGGRHYTRAQAAREVLATTVDEALSGVDVLAMPTMPDVAPPTSEATDPGFSYGRNTVLADVTRHPAITLPSGTVDGLPVGLQLVGGRFAEPALLGAARRVESVLSQSATEESA